MSWTGWKPVWLVLLSGLGGRVEAAELSAPTPLPFAHAHNDYEHQRPLLEALEQGFCSVEADVWLVDGGLLVAHDRDKVDPKRTLQKLYLEPLRERVAANGGRVFRQGPAFYLMIDFKSESTNTYLALRRALKDYASILTTFRSNRTETNAVTVIISGNRPRGLMESEPVRLAGYDARLADLAGGLSRHFAPWVSDNWRQVFQWEGRGLMPEPERMRLRQIVAQAHDRGIRLRFWGAPDVPEAWTELRAAGVDLINTDRLREFREFATNPEPALR